ncbi:MAG: FAD-binding oxidoreductase [Pseudomonadota bacterium]
MLSPRPQEHTGSYYAASANVATDYPRLLGAQQADVCVIGAGFTGVSTALHLVERGYSVAVVEANRVGWGASGRNGGQLIGGFSGEQRVFDSLPEAQRDMVWGLRWAGHEIVRDRIERYGIECDFKAGYIDVAIKPRHVKDLEEEAALLQSHAFADEFELLDAHATAELLGTSAYIGGLLNMGNGHLHPLNLCLGEAQAAVKLGVSVYEQSPVLRIERGKKAVVHTEQGSVEADFVVLAGNAYHFLEKKLRGALFPVNSFIMATEPLDEEQVTHINPRDVAVCDPNYILEYYRLSADKRLLFGGRCNYAGSDSEVIARQLTPRMLKIYPRLRGIQIDYAWGGTIGVTVNRVPQLGRISDNILYSQGYSGHGVNVTHLAGQIMADAVAGTLERFDVFSRIKPVRLPGMNRFPRQLVALGMLYYKLRDSL